MRLAWVIPLALLFLLAGALAPTTASAENAFERIVMPGPVISAHEKYESECSRCHEPFSKKQQSALCRDCHEAVDADMRASRGFHGRAPGVATRECVQCHAEHKGRDADIVRLDRVAFEHEHTDYPLRGEHASVPCQSCHAKGKKYREARSGCASCHRETDPHGGKLGERCDDCHSEKGWHETHFNHDETRFALRGTHQDTECVACHAAQRYKDTPRNCAACHRAQDVHAGRYGPDCERCHTDEKWKTIRFEHDRDTKFALEGRHGDVLCESCHATNPYETKLIAACIGCHRNDDQHRGRNGDQCGDCHDVNGWRKVSFDHDRDTRFALRGGHRTIDCAACHREPAARVRLESRCVSCHRSDDPHHDGLGVRCEKCHEESGWKKLSFDHDRDTIYPLLGAHAKARCESCHRENAYEIKLDTECIGCHERDDVHRGQQGRECRRCHREDGWRKQVRFDHDLTRFPLIGLHAAAPCEGCHSSAAFKDTQRACVDCHEQDDRHHGLLGADCASCHNANDWTLWEFDHDSRTQYPLQGRHEGLSCVACHTRPISREDPIGRSCANCHGPDDVHNGNFGADCERCHSTTTFKDVKPLH